MKHIINIFLLIIASGFLMYCGNHKKDKVTNIDEFNTAVQLAQPGDEIILANGVWKDAELLLEAKGTTDKPILLKAEEKGKVFLEGESNLRIAGEHLVVEGLVFRNGNTPTIEVISFAKDRGQYANNCRVTECVIDNYNNSERFESETWVAVYGKNNRVDHCYFTGKRNHGVTLIVRLVDSLCRENNHRIDHNYFGYRQNLGANGGETMRIGTSHYSLTYSNTVVEANYFDRCDGEHEIISNKSCGNVFKNNTFFECRGTLTYRHGNDNISEGNFFFGNGKQHTGGIRIINKRNKAINNYFYGLTGYRFRGALVIMNGVPDSPINRYHQVVGGEFINNTFINCDHIQLCAGSDEERSATPKESVVTKNIFYHDKANEIFTVYDDISGIKFSENILSNNIKNIAESGIKSVSIELKENEHGIIMPICEEYQGIGCTLQKPVATKENTGVSWYEIKEEELKFDAGIKIKVEPGLNNLYNAVKFSKPGDILLLKGGEEYKVNKKVLINHPLTIISDSDEKPILKTAKSSLFTIENGGSLKLDGLRFDGRFSQDKGGNSIISTSKYSMNRNYKLIVDNCEIENLDINHSFDFLKVYKNTFADSIVIRKSTFKNITGHVMALNKEIDELGIYNAEYVIFENSSFKDIQGTALSVVRGGTDESTFGPSVLINHCVFDNVGHGKRNKIKSAIYIHGVQIANIKNTIFQNSGALNLHMTNGEPITNVHHCNFYPSFEIKHNNKPYNAYDNKNFSPDFSDEEGFVLSMSSKLIGTGSEGENIGLKND